MARFSAPLLLGLSLLLVACATEPPAKAPQFRFTDRAPFFVITDRIAIVDDAHAVGDIYDIPGTASADPRQVVTAWVRDRLAASPGDAQMTVRIREAIVERTALPVAQGLEGLVRTQPIERLSARLAVEIEYRTPTGITRSSTSASSSQEVLENATANDRERAYFSLLETLAAEFDQTMSAELAHFLAPVR